MLQAEFTLYRFVCDLETFTGLFAEDCDGRHIPDTAAFSCVWASVPRSKVATMNPVQLEPNGMTSSTYFKSLSADMALTFPLATTTLRMNSDEEVLTFQIRPTQYNGGDIPVVAKGTLDPLPYFGKPRKNYAVKLRDASAQAIGKLIFNLAVTEADEEDTAEVQRAARESQSAARASQHATPSRPPPPARSSTGSRNPSMDRSPTRTGTGPSPLVDHKTPPSPAARVAVSTPPREERAANSGVVRQTSEEEGHSPLPTAPGAAQTVLTPAPLVSREKVDTAVAPTAAAAPVVQTLHIVFERVAVKPEEVTLDRPAPFIIGDVYTVKVRHGTSSHSTVNMTCTRGREIPLLDQETRLSLLAGGKEKLRFSLWENGKQVAGFSLSSEKFASALNQAKPYMIPFRYHPTNQVCTLELTVTRYETPLPPVVTTAGAEAANTPAAAVPPTASASPATVPTAPPPPHSTVATSAARVSPVKVLHRWGPGESSRAVNPTSVAVPVPRPHNTSGSGSRERSASSPAPHPVRGNPPAVPAPPQPKGVAEPPMHVAASRHTQLHYDAESNSTLSTPRPLVRAVPYTATSVADTAMELRVVEVAAAPSAAEVPRSQPYVTSLAGRGMWAGSPNGHNRDDGNTPLRDRTDTETSAVFPVNSLAVPRIVPETRRAHSRDPASTALGLPSEPQQADPFAQGRVTPVRSFLPRSTESRDHSLTATPVRTVHEIDQRGRAHQPSQTSQHGTPSRRAHTRVSDSPTMAAAEQQMTDTLARLDAMRDARNRTPLFDGDRDAPSASAKAHSRPSLLSDWQQWRNSRSGSAASAHDSRRSPSVSSAVSRDDSVASVSSRRCSPLPTKSFAAQAELRPVSTIADDDTLTHYRRRRGTATM